MDRFRKNLRDSFRKKKDNIPECSKPHQWQADEAAVRSSICNFSIKYLGCVEVFESRGMQVCEEALKVLRNSRRRPIKGTLYVTGDGLRVVDDETKGLLVDQTIEKVSFCAPDRNHEKGFSYICRDGTTRRWMCHGFMSFKDSGERLSHAVGCAFAVCLERKQKRDKEAVVMTFDPKTATFTRTGSFRQTSLTERMQNPQECKPAEPPPPLKPVHNPFAIERPHASTSLLQRQGSFRGFSTLNQTSPFKRQLSLRLSELPSTLERQKATSVESTEIHSNHNSEPKGKQDTINVLCQQVSQGLSLLSNRDDSHVTNTQISTLHGNHSFILQNQVANVDIPWMMKSGVKESCLDTWTTGDSLQPFIPCALNSDIASASTALSSISDCANFLDTKQTVPTTLSYPIAPPRWSSPNFSQLSSHSLTETSSQVASAKSSDLNTSEEHSVNSSQNFNAQGDFLKGSSQLPLNMGVCKDPFDADWAAIATRHPSNTNPFSQHLVKAFEVHM